MFTLSIHEKEITCADVGRYCLNLYPTLDTFEERLVRHKGCCRSQQVRVAVQPDT